MLSSGYLPRWISALFASMGFIFFDYFEPQFHMLISDSSGCLGCFQSSKGLTTQHWKLKRSSFSEDFWSSSACEIENSPLKPQRSISSISISSHSLDLSGSTSRPSEFVNHGKFICLLLWNQTRQQWVGNKKSEKWTQPRESMLSYSCNWNAVDDSLHGSTKHFPKPLPLSELVDFLDDVWEQEGLYD
ncbi:Elongation factor Tu, plastid [Gossypium arboreum]|uniref:Elongation factor Tu, plastid n=1 Tax=Gossypium arboreum TaxID=29729 RepID=A0A0B0NE83_GOSAR|nr:Elongation factor Tu, plastid [Gossypium arboreum]